MSLGYDAIDLDPIFFERHRRTGERFEFARDGHWSGVGHGATFDAVMVSRFMLRLLVNSKRAGSLGVSRARPIDVTFARPDLSVGRVNHPAGGTVAGLFPMPRWRQNDYRKRKFWGRGKSALRRGFRARRRAPISAGRLLPTKDRLCSFRAPPNRRGRT